VTTSPPHLHQIRPGRALAEHRLEGRGPAILFLPGYMSDMAGSKALALDEWARREGRAFLRFDYGGCGESPGAFLEQTLADWRDDAIAMIDSLTGPVVLVGSSMGGWIMLLAALARAEQVAALVGIAAAPDFTDWGYTSAEKEELRSGERLVRPSAYAAEGTPTSAAFWHSGEALRLLGDEIALDCPVRLLHGQADDEVPPAISLRVAERLRSSDVQTMLVKGGDHRLSRPQDLALLTAALAHLLESL
jgi:pimeloyl-ACP methyl ester carboxylesterase